MNQGSSLILVHIALKIAKVHEQMTGPHSAVGNTSDCRSWVASSILARTQIYWRLTISMAFFSLIQEGLLSVTSEGMYTKYQLTA